MTMPEWQTLPLGEALTFQRGFDITKDEQRNGPYPVISSSGPKTTHAEYKVRGPGVVIGRKGSLGTVFYSESDYWPHDTTLWVKDFHGNHPRFAYYFLQTMGFERLDAGASNPSLNRNHIHTIPVHWPSLPVQRRIAGILSAYDELIENNQRCIKILEEMARSLYREWFIHFRFPGHDKVDWCHTQFGNVPMGWTVPFADHVDFKEGPGLRNWQYRDSGTPFLNIRTLVDNDIDLSKVQFVDKEEAHGKYQHFLLEEHDHVVSSSGTIGRLVTIRAEHLPLMLNTSIIRMRPRGQRLGPWQLKHFLLSDYFQNQARSFAIGAAQPNFGPSHLKQMQILAPSEEVSLLYERLVKPMEFAIMSLARRNTNLRRTRDLLLPRLLSGEVAI